MVQLSLEHPLSSFPGLPCFYLLFAFIITREQKTGKKWGRPGSIHHMSGCEMDVGGEGYSNIYGLNFKMSFLPVKTSSFHHAKVWSPKTW